MRFALVMRFAVRAVVIALSVVLAACNSSNPVAPDLTPPPSGGAGTFSISVSASPPEILAGGDAPSTLTITVLRQDNQLAPEDGTMASVSVDQGSLGVNDTANPVRVSNVSLVGGRAQLSFFAGTSATTATVIVKVGQSTGQGSVRMVSTLPRTFFLTSVRPNSGGSTGGDRVTITGAGFKNPLRVTFGDIAARVVSVSNNSVVVVTPPPKTPPAPGASVPVDVKVTNDLTDTNPLSDTLPGGFFYSLAPDPEPTPVFITSVEPSSGTADGGTAVTVQGGGFQAPLQVTFGGAAAQVMSSTSTRINVITPPSPQPVAAGATQTVAVAVTSGLDQPAPQQASLPGAFIFLGANAQVPVVVSALSPAQGPYTGGTLVTVTGSGFVSPVSVTLGGVRQSAETVLSSTQVQFTTVALPVSQCPAGGVQTVNGVVVTNLGSGAAGNAALLSFGYQVPVARISRISPTSGPQLGNSIVSIEGSGFEAPVRVSFVKGTQTFTGVVQGTPTSTLVRVSSPRVPDTFFTEVDCVTADNLAGKRFQPATADVVVENLVTGCMDTFGNAFTYQPTFAQCRQVTPAP